MAFFVAGQILETSNIRFESDIASLDLNTNLSLGGPAQSVLRDASRAADSDATLRSRSPRGQRVSNVDEVESRKHSRQRFTVAA
jgi:hypothetical protein